MDRSEKASEEPKGEEPKGGEPEKHDDTIIHSVARSVGTAIGVIASTATKVIGESHPTDSHSAEPKRTESQPAEPRSETKPKTEKPRKVSKKAAPAPESQNKLQASRLAKKKKKRAAHRTKLRRSNTKG